VAKKPPHRHATAASPAELENRVRRAVQEGRYQNALELGKQLCRQESTPAREELLRTIYLGRIRQLRVQGYTKDARSLIDHVLQLGHREPAWLEQLAVELAACGDPRRALELSQALPNSQVQTQIHSVAVDQALALKEAGRAQLPEALREQFDFILKAFAQLEAGQDDAVKETLQGIGLQSPFLEWKLLLRGLQAYYRQEDERALDNWNRLKPDRLPARLAAPLRFAIDPSYAQLQSPDTQAALRRQADRLHSSGLAQSLRSIQSALTAESLPQALQLAEGVLPALRRDAPQQLSRLAACLQSATLRIGNQRDLQRFKRVFGAPPEDPQLDRLEALALEGCGDLEQAHKHWQKYEQSVANHPEVWPSGQAARVRALVWLRMGNNAASIPDNAMLKDAPPWIKNMPGRPKALKPTAEQCFQRSLALDPELVDVHEELFDFYRVRKQEAKAVEVGKKLLERFPEHLPTLSALSELLMTQGDHAEAVSLLQRALKVNPLERHLRGLLGTAHTHLARSRAEAGDYDQARVEYQAALALENGAQRYPVLCKWAACEFKAGNAERAEELLRQAHADAGQPLAVSYQMLIEAIRLKLKAPLKKRFETEFADGLDQPRTVPAALALLDSHSQHVRAGVKYTGQKTHEKKVLAYYDKMPLSSFTEAQLVQAGQALVGLKDGKRLKKIAEKGKHRFHKNPRFELFEVDSYLWPKPKRTGMWRVRMLFDHVRRSLEKLPPDEQKEVEAELLRREAVLLRENLLDGPPLGFLPDFMGGMFEPQFVDDDEYDDDGW
jgi:tetratricopeptide (TPR) repeat protein